MINKESLSLFFIRLSPFSAFTQNQRRWIRQRDDEKCQAPFNHKEDLINPKQVHHIKPQGYLKRVAPEVSPDFPENGITLCRNAHEIIHPDVIGARHQYSQDQGSFGKLMEERKDKLDKRKIYWNDEFDRPMKVIALRNTRRFEKDFKFPEKK